MFGVRVAGTCSNMADVLNDLLGTCGETNTLSCKDGGSGDVLYAGSDCSNVVSGLNSVIEKVGFKPNFDRLSCSFLGYVRERGGGCSHTIGYLNAAVTLNGAGQLEACEHTSQTTTQSSTVSSTMTTSITTTVTTKVLASLDCVTEDDVTYLSVTSNAKCNAQKDMLYQLLEACPPDTHGEMVCAQGSLSDNKYLFQVADGKCGNTAESLGAAAVAWTDDDNLADAFSCLLDKILVVDAAKCTAAVKAVNNVRSRRTNIDPTPLLVFVRYT